MEFVHADDFTFTGCIQFLPENSIAPLIVGQIIKQSRYIDVDNFRKTRSFEVKKTTKIVKVAKCEKKKAHNTEIVQRIYINASNQCGIVAVYIAIY